MECALRDRLLVEVPQRTASRRARLTRARSSIGHRVPRCFVAGILRARGRSARASWPRAQTTATTGAPAQCRQTSCRRRLQRHPAAAASCAVRRQARASHFAWRAQPVPAVRGSRVPMRRSARLPASHPRHAAGRAGTRGRARAASHVAAETQGEAAVPAAVQPPAASLPATTAARQRAQMPARDPRLQSHPLGAARTSSPARSATGPRRLAGAARATSASGPARGRTATSARSAR